MSESPSVYTQLQNRLTSGEFEPGMRLRSDLLAKDYGVSASTIREQLFRLSTIGLADFWEQKGFRVPQQSVELQHDLTQTRIMLECEGTCLSIRYGGIAWEAKLTAAHHELLHIEKRIHTAKTLPRPTDEGFKEIMALWAEAELTFHRTLIAKCQSQLLMDFHQQVYLRFRQQLITTDKDFIHIPKNLDQHHNILEAVLQRDEDLAQERIREHLSRHLAEPRPEKLPPLPQAV